jgi:hypothetical protein
MFDLTNYEMLELANSHISNASDDLNRLAAVVSAYLVVAYRVGRDLTLFQVATINVFFTVVAGQAVVGAGAENTQALMFWAEVYGEEPIAGAILIREYAWIPILAGYFVCLTFMWRVRHPKEV